MSPDGAVVVRLLATGGTIATTTGADGRTAPRMSAGELARLAGRPGISIEARELSREPSWALDPSAMAEIAIAARDAAREEGVAGVVLTHGTTTLEYTAFLADLVLDVATPVVLTGAMRRADDPHADGPRNLRDAIEVAASDEARGRGALVVFAGRVISGHRAWKARRDGDDAFVDLAGDLGSVSEGRIEIGASPGRCEPFSGRLERRVSLVKVVPGDDGAQVASAVDAGAHGIVIEGLPGAGGIPRAMQHVVAKAASHIPVAIASRAPYGRLPSTPTGGTGEPLRALDLLSAGPLTTEQAWLLLMAVLADATSPADASRRFVAAIGAMT